MPNYVLRYDVNTNHIETSSNVYQFLARRLRHRGWTRHQYSCWRANGKRAADAFNEATFFANALEAQYGVGVVINLEYQRHLVFIQIR